MDYFDQKINDIYNQPIDDIPADLSWENMEESIYTSMEKDQPKRRALWYWISGAILLLTAIAAVTMYNSAYDKESTTIVAKNTTKNTDTTTPSKKVVTPNTENIKTDKSSIQSTNTIAKNTNHIAHKPNPIITNNTNTYPNTPKENSLSQSNESQVNNVFINSNSALNIDLNTGDANENNNTAQLQKRVYTTTTNTPVAGDIPRSEINVGQLHSLSIFVISNNKNTIESDVEYITSALSKDDPIDNTSYDRYVNLSSGTTLNTGYDIGKNTYKSTLPGYNVRLGYTIENEKGWGLQVGLGHSLLVEEFDLDLTDTVPELHTDVAIRTIKNSVSGNVITEYGDAYRDVERYRRELSYNTINLLSLDAAISKRLDIANRWSVIPSVGFQYDRLISVEGKSLDAANELLVYDNATDGINKNLFSGKLGIQLQYQLTDRWSLSAMANQTYSINKLYSNGSPLGITYLSGGIAFRI